MDIEAKLEKTEQIIKVIYVIIIFLAGFVFSQLVNTYSLPISYYLTGYSIATPSDFLSKEDILVYDDRVVILIDKPGVRNYNSTGSMLPFLGEDANGIVIKPESVDDINVGDIITFNHGDKLIVHRVVDKGLDDKGVFFITKGDNATLSDGKIRFSDIEFVLIAIVY